MPDAPAGEKKHTIPSERCSEAIFKTGTSLPFIEPRSNLRQLLLTICEVLTVLMLTLMTGMRERHDDEGSGLSALMFTLKEDHETFN